MLRLLMLPQSAEISDLLFKLASLPLMAAGLNHEMTSTQSAHAECLSSSLTIGGRLDSVIKILIFDPEAQYCQFQLHL